MIPSPGNNRAVSLEQFALWLIAGVVGLYFSGGILPPLFYYLGWDAPASALLHVYGHTCHQLADRSFLVAGSQFGFCARCVGFYGGLLAGSLYTAARKNRIRPSPLWVVSFSLLMLVDAIFSLTPERQAGNLLRALLGIPTGFLLSAWALSKLRSTLPDLTEAD